MTRYNNSGPRIICYDASHPCQQPLFFRVFLRLRTVPCTIRPPAVSRTCHRTILHYTCHCTTRRTGEGGDACEHKLTIPVRHAIYPTPLFLPAPAPRTLLLLASLNGESSHHHMPAVQQYRGAGVTSASWGGAFRLCHTQRCLKKKTKKQRK